MKGSKKEKKITVKFFLNELVEPAVGERGQKHYPLYLQVTYNRKNMQFKSKYSEYYGTLEEVRPGLMQFEEKIIRSIIAYEAGKIKDEYDLKGLKRKYDVYSISLLEAVEKYLKPKLRLAILKTNDELTNVLNFYDQMATVGLLYKAAGRLFRDFDRYTNETLQVELEAYKHYQMLYSRPILSYNFPTVIEWVDGSYKEELEKKLIAVFKNKAEIAKEVKSLINQAIKKTVKQLEE